MHLTFDLETVKNDRADMYVENKAYLPKKGLVKEDAIAKNIEAQRQKDIDGFGFKWWTSQICAIGFFFSKLGEYRCLCGENEKNLLTDFFNIIRHNEAQDETSILMVGKNVRSFDIPMIRGRAMYHDIGLPLSLQDNRNVFDCDDIFKVYSSMDMTSKLETYAFGIGLSEGKSGDGSQVQGWFDQGAFDTIRAYCLDDLKITEEVYRRFKKVYGVNHD